MATRRAFTAVEMAVTAAVLAVLTGLLLAGLGMARNAAREAEAERVATAADLAARAAHASDGAWPKERGRHRLTRGLARELGKHGFSPGGAAFDGDGADAPLLDPWGAPYRYDVGDAGGTAEVPGERADAFWAARGLRELRVYSTGRPDADGNRVPARYIYPPSRDEGAPASWFEDDGYLKPAHADGDGGLSPAARNRLPRPGGGLRRWKEKE